jgi:hypothetical protein
MGIWDILYGVGDIHPLLKLGDGPDISLSRERVLFGLTMSLPHLS